VTGIGNIKILLGKSQPLTLHDTLYAPQAALCLISIGHLTDEGLTCLFEKRGCTIHNSTCKTLAEGKQKGHGLYTLKGRQPRAKYGLLTHAAPLLLTWYKRLEHLGYKAVIDMAKLGLTKGM